MDEVVKWFADHGVELVALLLALWSAWKSNKADKRAEDAEEKTEEANRKAEENRAELQRVQEDHIASDCYSHVKELERLFEDAYTNLTVKMSNPEASEDDKLSAFLATYNRYTDLYNEINGFCTLINNGSIKAEEYIRVTALQKLIDHADLQWKNYQLLTKIAKDNNMRQLPKPRYEAFKGYDEFLKKHFKNDRRWEQLQENRKKAGLI